MIAEISAGFSSLNAAKQIIQGLDALKTGAAINEVKIELQGLILEAHQGLFAGQQAEAKSAQRISELEQEIVRLKDWSRERERYELTKFHPGTLAYVLKPSMANGEPLHMLCKHCYDRTQKSALQATARVEQRFRIHACPSCKTEYSLGGKMSEAEDSRLGG